MLRLLGTALTLGIAGIDPAGALIVLAALLAGATRRAVTVCGITMMVGIPLFGTALSLTLGARLSHLDWWVLVPAGRVGAVVGLVLGVALLAVAAVRVVRHRDPRPAKPKRVRVGTLALVGAALLYVVSLAIDPTFVAVTVLAGRTRHVPPVVLMQLIWAVLSQLPLLVLLGGVELVGRERAVSFFQHWWARARPVIGWLITAALVIAGVALVLDAVWWFSHRHFLLFGPHRRR